MTLFGLAVLGATTVRWQWRGLAIGIVYVLVKQAFVILRSTVDYPLVVMGEAWSANLLVARNLVVIWDLVGLGLIAAAFAGVARDW